MPAPVTILIDHLLAALDQPALETVSQLLFATIPYYTDRESRLAVQKCLVTIVQQRDVDPKLVVALVKGIRREAQKPVIAVSTSFALVEWCSLLMQKLAGSPLWDQVAENVLLCGADSFERCLQPTSKHSVVHSATIVMRRGFRRLFDASKSQETVLAGAVKVLTAKGSQPSAKNAPLLGVIAGVCSRRDALRPLFASSKPQYYEFYTREIVSSKTAVPRHIAAGLRDFFYDFATLEDLEKEVVPTIEKGLLRAPEVILTGVLGPLVLSLPAGFDLSKILKERLMKHLLSSIKSSNAQVRTGAVSSFREIVSRSGDEKMLEGIVEEILAPLKGGKLSSADHRILHAEMLEGIHLPQTSAPIVASGIATIASKEGNEPALVAETSALARAISQILTQQGDIPKPVLDTLSKGLSDKKHASRKLWLLLVAHILRDMDKTEPSSGETSFVEAVVPKLVDNFNEVVTNPATSVQNGIMVGAYALTALAPALQTRFVSSSASEALSKASTSAEALAPSGKHFFLLNSRIYTKVGAEADLRWFVLALSSLSATLRNKAGEDLLRNWAEAFIYVIAGSDIPTRVQQQAITELTQLYTENPGLTSKTLIDGLWSVLQTSTKDKDLKLIPENLLGVLKSICLETDEGGSSVIPKEQRESQACALLVLARPELVPRSSWIMLCLRMGIDPGTLALEHQDVLLKEVGRRASDDTVSSAFVLNKLGSLIVF